MARRRNPRVEQAVKQALAELLEKEIADPRVSFTTITDVRVTEDHKQATVYYTTLDRDLVARDPLRSGGDPFPSPDQVADGLVSAAPRLQGLLARRVRLRNTPTLSFQPDPVAAASRRIAELLRRVESGGGGDTEDTA